MQTKGCFSVCRSDSHARLLSFSRSFGSEVGRGRDGMTLNGFSWVVQLRGIWEAEGGVQGVGTLFVPRLCGVGANLHD